MQQSGSTYSTIFQCHTEEGNFGFVCFLRLLEGVISVLMFWMFFKGYRVISAQRNNKLSRQDKNLYMLGLFQTLLVALYYLLFAQFFMLATIRNLLIWISINVLYASTLIYYDNKKPAFLDKALYVLQGVNFIMWLLISFGEGMSIQNVDVELSYNCKVIHWMVMSGILLAVNLMNTLLSFFNIDKLNFELKRTHQDDTRKIASITREKMILSLITITGLLGSMMMFAWDFIAYNPSSSNSQCKTVFSGDTFFRNLLCFVCKLITMQLNPLAIYFINYHSRSEDFAKEEVLMEDTNEVDLFAHGPSVCAQTVSDRRSSAWGQSSHRISQY